MTGFTGVGNENKNNKRQKKCHRKKNLALKIINLV